MSRRKVGRIRERLAALLLLQRIVVAPEDLWMQEGFYRNKYHDLARWGSYRARWVDDIGPDGKPCGSAAIPIHLCSWDTMTDCVRNGCTIGSFERDGRWGHVEVYRAEKP